MNIYYNPVTKLLHAKVHSSWSIGYDTLPHTMQVQLSSPSPEIAEQLIKLGDPEDHLDILTPWLNTWKVRGAHVGYNRPRGWFNAKTVAKMKREREIIFPEERIISCTREGKSNWISDTAQYLLDKSCAVCAAPATIVVDTLIPEGTVDQLEGCRVMPGNRILSFCDTHIPAGCTALQENLDDQT